MNTGYRLLRILCIDFIFSFSILFGNGKDAQSGKGFEWIGGLRVEHAETKVKIVGDICNCHATGDAQNKTLENDSNRSHV